VFFGKPELECVLLLKYVLSEVECVLLLKCVLSDVGFGKTEVALRAILTSALAGRQSILLAPTTVLAAQHFRKVEERFIPLGII